jgi:hypothetical protein
MRHQTHTKTGPLMFAAIILIALGGSARTRAQELQLGIDFNTVIPQSDFKQNVKNNGFGVSGNFLVGLGRSPLLAGVDVGFATYGHESRRVPLSGNIPDITLKVDTDNNILLTHFLLRAQPRHGAVRPYVDGLVGFKYLFTKTTVESDSGSEPLASDNNLSDFAFSYGLGGGVQARIARLGHSKELLFDAKARYLWGSQARYLKEGSIQRVGGTAIFDVLSSRTNVVTLQFGVGIRF